VEPRFVEWDGDGTPEAFVVSENLRRRHLNESQRAMIAAKIAKAKAGENQHVKEVAPIGATSITKHQAATLLNISAKSVERAKAVQGKGTPEEIKAVEEGRATVTGTAERIKSRQKQGNGKPRRHPVHYKRHHAKILHAAPARSISEAAVVMPWWDYAATGSICW